MTLSNRVQPKRKDILRNAVISSIPDEPSQFDAVDPKYVYVPAAHVRALDPDAMLVVGIRGAGKSFWWHALQKPSLRTPLFAGSERRPSLIVTAGFGLGSNEQWPDRDEIGALRADGHAPRLIWKAVVLRQIAPDRVPSSGWGELVGWVEKNPSQVAALIRARDGELRSTGEKHLVLFDALDRTADAWTERQELLRGLLELVLELRALSSIRAKVFVRPDMLDDPQTKAFPDASKVVASRVSLDWPSRDLYGLLFRYLGNGNDARGAAAFRELCSLSWAGDSVRGYEVPPALRTDEAMQERVFVQLAGPYMGKDRRRGKTYTWVPNHLSDAFGNVSPRSFLAAIRRAAIQPEVPGQDHALHWSGLQEGVRRASEYRVEEVAEDLPWAREAMSLLTDVVVPCKRQQLISAWNRGKLSERLADANLRAPIRDGLEAIVADLVAVGILEHLPDGRVNVPDVYRVGFRLRRMGGFVPT